MRNTVRLSLLFLVALCCVSFAKADTIGPVCSSCNGASYTLNYHQTANPSIVDVTLSINTANTSSSDLLKAVSLKVVSQFSEILDITTLTAPAGFSDPVAGGTSASSLGCNGKGNGFFCSETSSNGVAVGPAASLYNFAWQITLQSPGDLLTGNGEASLKAIYLTQKPNGRVGLGAQTSEDISLTELKPQITVTPEPASLLLMATGLLGAAVLVKLRPRGVLNDREGTQA